MDNPKELKKAILASLAEKGDYATILKHLSSEEKEEKSEKLTKLITPISAFADILTENSKGAFMEDLTSRLDETTKNGLSELTKSIETAKKELQGELKSLLSSTKDSLTTEHLARYKQAEEKLQTAMMQMCVEIVSAKANEILPTLSEQAKLTEDEIEDIIYQSALSVESQMTDIVGDYVSTASFTVSQIADFRDKVIELIPQVDPSKFSIDWSQVRNTPSVGGTNANLVKQIVDEAIVAIESLPDQTGNSGKFLTTNGTAASWGVPAGSGDVIKVGTPVNNQVGVWTGDGTIEGVPNLTWNPTSNWIEVIDPSGSFGIPFRATSGGGSGGVIDIYSSNGTVSSPTVSIDNDFLGGVDFVGYATLGYSAAAGVYAEVDGSVGSNYVPGSFVFFTNSSSGQHNRFKISSTDVSVINNSGIQAILDTSSLASTDKTFTFPNQSGTFALTSDIGSGGIVRSVVVTSGSVTMGSTAGTDYVYLVAGAHTMSLPAASGNTNRYTVKNNHSANITVDTAGAETIDGSASISLAPEEAVDIISNGTNFNII